MEAAKLRLLGIYRHTEKAFRHLTIRAARPNDHAAVFRLLEQAGLPLAGVPDGLDDFIVDEIDGEVVGVIGLERYDGSALLRSAVVDPDLRGLGVGARLVEGLLAHARRQQIQDIYLLTTTAEDWFPRFGFRPVDRDAVPPTVRMSVEFREACPASAAVMRTSLAGESLLLHPERPMRVLFLCTGNWCRSQIAEVVLNRKGVGRFIAESAGSNPAPQVHPLAIEALERFGYRWPGNRVPRGLDGLLTRDWDAVITVCDRAKEVCPNFASQPALAYWGMPDPSEVTGTYEERSRAFDDIVIDASRRIDLLLALPVEKLSRLILEVKLNEIGRGGVLSHR